MRLIVYGLFAFVVGMGLVLFDDVDVGLPIINLIVWPIVAVIGFALVMRRRQPPPRLYVQPRHERVVIQPERRIGNNRRELPYR